MFDQLYTLKEKKIVLLIKYIINMVLIIIGYKKALHEEKKEIRMIF